VFTLGSFHAENRGAVLLI